jgi:hypothetical protein
MAKLTSAERNALPSSEFAEPAERKYPINDPSHARNALARASQHASPAAKSKISAKVHKKFPSIGHGSAMGHLHDSGHHSEHEGDGHHSSMHHGGHHHHEVNVHLHMGKGKKKFSI